MLYLTRKIGESVVINDDIEVTVVDIRGKSIKLGFTFPPEASVLRREIYERIQEENRAAAGGSDALADVLGGNSSLAPQPSRDNALTDQGLADQDPTEPNAVKQASRSQTSVEESPVESASQPSRQE